MANRYIGLQQSYLDESLRIASWELVYGTASPEWADRTIKELLAAGARWNRTEEERTYGVASNQPVFESSQKRIFDECLGIGSQRGGEYADTWALENQVSTFLDATLRAVGAPALGREEKRLLLLAALIDVKDSRMIGPYKEDSVADGLNYRAVFMDLMRSYQAKAS